MIKRRTALPVPKPVDKSGAVSWIHFGDLHMGTRDADNFRDLSQLVSEVNGIGDGSFNFAYVPGDNADHGTAEEYELVREALDLLQLPWFAIVGDHDVHPRSHANFLRHMMPMPFYMFECGDCRFFALDAFASDNPKTFDLSMDQVEWLLGELQVAGRAKKHCVLFLHCYPSELKATAKPLCELIRKHDVLLVDMGHTHYNEIAHDGRTLYTVTRSTGQIEEGPVGFSVTNIDKGIVSWRFKALGEWPLVMITSPGDERLQTHHGIPNVTDGKLKVRVKSFLAK
jgi:Icc protein